MVTKHGRVSTVATMGYNAPETSGSWASLRRPGMSISPTFPMGFAAVSKVPGLGWVQIILLAHVVVGKVGSKLGLQDHTSAVPGALAVATRAAPHLPRD